MGTGWEGSRTLIQVCLSGERGEGREGGWMDVFYSVIHSKESLVRPWEVEFRATVTTGGCVESHQAKVACQSCPTSPTDRPALVPQACSVIG